MHSRVQCRPERYSYAGRDGRKSFLILHPQPLNSPQATVVALGKPYPSQFYLPLVELAIMRYLARIGMPPRPVALAVMATPTMFKELMLGDETVVLGGVDRAMALEWSATTNNCAIRKLRQEQVAATETLQKLEGQMKINMLGHENSRAFKRLQVKNEKARVELGRLVDKIMHQWKLHGKPRNRSVGDLMRQFEKRPMGLVEMLRAADCMYMT